MAGEHRWTLWRRADGQQQGGVLTWRVKATLAVPQTPPGYFAAGVQAAGTPQPENPSRSQSRGAPQAPAPLHSIPGPNKENRVCRTREPKSRDRECHAAPWSSCRAPSGRVCRPPRGSGRAPPGLPDQNVQYGVEKPRDGHGFREE